MQVYKFIKNLVTQEVNQNNLFNCKTLRDFYADLWKRVKLKNQALKEKAILEDVSIK